MRATATLSLCGRFVDLHDGAWGERFPVALLAQRIAFYERLAERISPRLRVCHRASYQPTIDALRAVQRQLEARAA